MILNIFFGLALVGLLAGCQSQSAVTTTSPSRDRNAFNSPGELATAVRDASSPNHCPPEYKCEPTGFAISTNASSENGFSGNAYNGQASVGTHTPYTPTPPAQAPKPHAMAKPPEETSDGEASCDELRVVLEEKFPGMEFPMECEG